MRLRRDATLGRIWPPELTLGVILVAVAWPIAWFGPQPYANYTFFPLWLGYILTVDGWAFRRRGTSLLSRNWRRFVLLFAFSLPLWWLFEVANQFLHDWRYVLPRHYPPAVYVALASLDFSTVMPAILVTAELYRSFAPFAAPRRWLRILLTRAGMATIAGFGLLLVAGALAFPAVLFPLVWIGLFLFVDAINALTGGQSIASQVARGHWDTVLVLFAAGLTCGLFWEMWNFWSRTKWVYDVPHVGHPKLFEMPLLGYGGYLPFALEVYAVYHVLHTVVFHRRDTYLDVVGSAHDVNRAAIQP